LRPAILLFDSVQKTRQRGQIRRIAFHYLIGQGKAFGRDDQSDDHLQAVRPTVPAVAPLGFRIQFRFTFHIGAGQVVEQQLELGSKQRLPALLQVPKQCLLVHQQPVQAAVEPVFAGHGKVCFQQLIHRTLVKPLPMQSPLTARVHQPVHRQQLDHLVPGHRFPPFRQLLLPEVIQLQQTPDLAPQPAIAKPPRPPQLHPAQLDSNRIHLLRPQRRRFQQRLLSKRLDRLALALAVKAVEQVLPGCLLQLVDLSQIQHRALGDLVVGHTTILHHTVIVVNLAIFLALGASQEHDPSLRSPPTGRKGVGLHYKPFSPVFETPVFIARDLAAKEFSFRLFFSSNCESWGNKKPE